MSRCLPRFTPEQCAQGKLFIYALMSKRKQKN
jgi:hypothetical protein